VTVIGKLNCLILTHFLISEYLNYQENSEIYKQKESVVFLHYISYIMYTKLILEVLCFIFIVLQ